MDHTSTVTKLSSSRCPLVYLTHVDLDLRASDLKTSTNELQMTKTAYTPILGDRL